MLEISYIARPLIGAVIGYITNDIAIRMLFRPRTAKYVFGCRLPFTPGIIPKEKGRIAAAVGNTISKNLMNRGVVEKTLLSDEMIGKIESAMTDFVDRQKHNDETVEEFLLHHLSKGDVDKLRLNISTDLSKQIHSTLSSADLGSKVASIVVAHVTAKLKNGMFGMFGADQIVGMVAGSVESLLAKNIDEMLADHSEEMVSGLLDSQLQNFLSLRMKDLLAGRERQIEDIETTIISLYRRLISQQLPKILDNINISSMIENRINEMDVKESEQLILGVMNRELKAIVWLGALLGFAMGCINLIF